MSLTDKPARGHGNPESRSDRQASRRIEVHNPANPEEVVGTILRGTVADVNAAVAAAKRAQPAWAARTFCERAGEIDRALEALNAGIETRSRLYVRENGKVLSDASGELAGIPGRQRMVLALAEQMDAGRRLDGPNGPTSVLYKPYGVVVSIVPWNAPLSLGFSQIVTALLAGNTVVVKPPESCPLTLLESIALFCRALPENVVTSVTGLPGEIGDALTTHPDVAKIAFTGSVQSARQIMANAARSIKSVTLELGGNDAAIVLADADLGAPNMERMVRAAFRMTGQVCMAIKRIYVAESIAAPFLAAFVASADRIVIGNGLDPQVTMGPMHTRVGLDRAAALVADAATRGATVREVGTCASSATAGRGYFMRPTVVSNCTDDALLMSEEQFCPAVPISTYRDVDNAVERSNATTFGLGGSVWGNVHAATSVAARLQAGTVFVNTHGTEAIDRRAPYGGMRQSGLGRKSGLEGLLDYIELQTMTVRI